MLINSETFIADKKELDVTCDYNIQRGSVEVTLRGETRRVAAIRFSNGDISARGVAIKYRTGTKLWPASIRQQKGNDGVYEVVTHGRDDRSSRFNLTHNLFWMED